MVVLVLFLNGQHDFDKNIRIRFRKRFQLEHWNPVPKLGPNIGVNALIDGVLSIFNPSTRVGVEPWTLLWIPQS